MQTRPRLLIDTDPGVDDALAILMAHAHADVVGLSVAAGNTGLAHTVRNACRLLDLLDADMPVFAGCPTPLVRRSDEDAVQVHGTDGFGDAGLPEPRHRAEPEHAAHALIRLTREHPGELTLVALAPLTNLALALKLDPGLPARVKRLVVMGGAVNGRGNMARPPVEFNIGFDPEAAHVVFEAFPAFDLVDWELTLRHAFDEAEFDRWLAAGDARAAFFKRIAGAARAYNARRERRGVIAADALAMAVAIDPAVVTRTEQHAVAVELDGRLTRGMTVVDRERRQGAAVNANIVLELDQARFAALVQRALGVPDGA
ncbi:MAG TPA: nucleoside hydrolase [Rhodanobacteraceae bacterium]|nr:nucleoside hydrolase [Rhodanobacteraceae bacterium]